MLEISNEDILRQTELVEGFYKKGDTEPLPLDKFLNRAETLFNKGKDFEPYEARIAKSNSYIKQGDLEPERIIRVDSPILGPDGTPYWTGTTEDEIVLSGFGYRNGDSRYPSTLSLGDKSPHGVGVGVTGHGKSVKLNSILFGAMTRYAPWELRIIMADAKVAEFKRYSRGYVPPHIRTIAATTDADYIISVLEWSFQQMEDTNAAFSAVGYKDLMGFRRGTGLIMPRTLIVIDEVQAMITNAKKKASRIEEKFDGFGRLGRNAGFHLYMSSQDPSPIPKGTMKNLTLRASLGADAETSTMVLGNDEAKINYGKRGRVIVNTNSVVGKKADNEHYRVPYQSDKLFEDQKTFLHELGERFGFSQPLSFYDGESYLNENTYPDMIKVAKPNRDRLILGEPSFVLTGTVDDSVLGINFTNKDIENILIYCNNQKSVSRFCTMLGHNMQYLGKEVVNDVYCANSGILDSVDFRKFANVYETREFTHPSLQQGLNSVYLRKLILDSEGLAFSGLNNTPQAEDLIEELYVNEPEKQTTLNKVRATALMRLLNGEEYIKKFKIPVNNATDAEKIKKMHIKTVIDYCTVKNCSSKRLTLDMLIPVYNWIIGLDKMLGLGTDYKPSNAAMLKGILQDSFYTNTRFICTLVNPEGLKELNTGFRYTIMDGLSDTMALKMNVSDYPQDVGKVLGVLFDKDSDDREAVKFKKMAFDGEILT